MVDMSQWDNRPVDVVAFLQCAWFHPRITEAQARTYRLWFYAFWKSRSGQRLRYTFGEDWVRSVGWENASPQIGRKSRDRFPFDPDHIRERLKVRRPRIVLAFSEEAERGLVECWDGDLIAAPHPAYMCLTNQLLVSAALTMKLRLAARKSEGPLRTAFRQRKGRVDVEDLPRRLGVEVLGGPPDPHDHLLAVTGGREKQVV